MGTTQGGCILIWKNAGSSTPQNKSCTATYLSSHKSSEKDGQNMLDPAGQIRTNTLPTFSKGHTTSYIDIPLLANLQKNSIHQLCADTGCHLEDLP